MTKKHVHKWFVSVDFAGNVVANCEFKDCDACMSRLTIQRALNELERYREKDVLRHRFNVTGSFK